MFGLLNRFVRTRKPQPRPTPRRSTRLWLEQLETRDCPSSITLAVTMNGLRSVTLSGNVSNLQRNGMTTVSFTGVVVSSTTTDVSGHYSFTADASALGTVTASTLDAGGTTITANATVACAPPVISPVGWSRDAGVLTITGTVTHPDAVGMTINVQAPGIASLQNGATTTADHGGAFVLTANIGASEGGSVNVSCTDCWGQSSNIVQIFVY